MDRIEKPIAPSAADAVKPLMLQVHASTRFKEYLESIQSIDDPKAVGRQIGVKLFELSQDTTATMDALLEETEKKIISALVSQVDQSIAWSNLRKGFIGNDGTFDTALIRAKAIESYERSHPNLTALFGRHSVEHQNAFGELVAKQFSHLSKEQVEEGALILSNMSVVREDLLAYQAPFSHIVKIKELTTEVASDILGAIAAYRENNPAACPLYVLNTLSRIGNMYDKASSRIHEGQAIQYSLKKKSSKIYSYLVNSKLDLFKKIKQPEQIGALISSVEKIAALMDRGSYVAWLFIETSNDYPFLVRGFKQRSRLDRSSLAKRYNDICSHYESNEQSKALRAFTRSTYLIIAMRCLNVIPEHDPHHREISSEVADLSEYIFEKAYDIESAHLSRLYGKPTCPAAFLVGGANARREYPSFDYDAFILYEKEGFTDTSQYPDATTMTHQEYYKLLTKRIASRIQGLGGNFDSGFLPHDSLTYESEWAYSLDGYEKVLQVVDKHLELRLRMGLKFFCGDEAFGQHCLSWIEEKSEDSKQLMLSTQASACLTQSKEKINHERVNIKLDAGGLRMLTRLSLICISAFSDQSLLTHDKLLAFLEHKNFLTKQETQAITASYELLIAIRVRLDMHYGRNDKYLPSGNELIAFAKSLGYRNTKKMPADEQLLTDIDHAMQTIDRMTSAALEKIGKHLQDEYGLDIFDYSEAKRRAEVVEEERRFQRHMKAIREQEGGFMGFL
jgi:hypothetical protein